MNFPIGVLLYWLTTNVWSMGQQFYVIRRNPAPGSPAAEALERAQGGQGGPAPRGRPATAAGRGTRTAVDPDAPPAPKPSGQRPAAQADQEAEGRRPADPAPSRAGSDARPANDPPDDRHVLTP